MDAKFTMHISITERNVVLDADADKLNGVNTQLAIAFFKVLEGTRARLKQTIEKFYAESSESSKTEDENDEAEGTDENNNSNIENGKTAAAESAQE